MANLSFVAGGRRRTLCRRKAGGPFYIRFQHNGKEIPRSLGTTSIDAAKEKAKQIIEAETNGDVHAARSLRVKTGYAALEQIAKVYLENYCDDDKKHRSGRGNVGSLTKLVRLGAGIANPLGALATVLNDSVIRNFEKELLKTVERDGRGMMKRESEIRIRTTIDSTVTQAKVIFKPVALNWYAAAGLVLPDLTAFRRQTVTPAPRPKPRPLDEGMIEQINAAAPALKQTRPQVYASHLLFKFLGMRNGEQKKARRSWIVRDGKGGGKIGIIDRPEDDFWPKKSERWIGIAPAVLAELDNVYTPSPDGDFLVPAKHATERAAIIDDEHSAWAKQWIRGRSKTSYELRRYAGSLIYKKTGRIEHVRNFLGHADLATTLNWYWYLIDETPAIDMSDCIAAPNQFRIVA